MKSNNRWGNYLYALWFSAAPILHRYFEAVRNLPVAAVPVTLALGHPEQFISIYNISLTTHLAVTGQFDQLREHSPPQLKTTRSSLGRIFSTTARSAQRALSTATEDD